MDRCKNSKLGKLRHAYGLGVLDPDQNDAFEVHLMECAHCYELIRNIDRASNILRNDQKMLLLLGADETATDEQVPVMPGSDTTRRIRRRPTLMRILAVATIIAVVLVLRPWNIGIQTTEEARAGSNVLAVMYLQNLVEPDDPERLGDIATNLLITDLSESAHLQVVSSQRLYDILKLLGREGDRRVQPDVASEVAARARAKWMLSGSILQIEPHFVVATQLLDVSTGNVLGSQKVIGGSDDDIFALVDKLTVAVKDDLPLPQQASTERDPPVADVTTSSRDAYRFYLEAKEYMIKFYYTEAIVSYEKALEYDSTLAQAYCGLAVARADTAYLAKALQYIDNVSQLDKHYILATAAGLRRDRIGAIEQYEIIVDRYPDEKMAYCKLGAELAMQGELDTSIYYFREAIRIDPLFKHAYNWLAYIYDDLGFMDSAIAALDEYVALAPTEANPYDSRGEIYAGHGRIDEAIQSFEEALEIKPDFYPTYARLGYMYLFKGDYERADSCFRRSVAKSGFANRPASRLRLALVSLRRGRLERALQILNDGIVADQLDFRIPTQLFDYHLKFHLRAAIYAERGEFKLALAEEEEYLRLNAADTTGRPICFPSHYVWYLAENGRLSEAGEYCEQLKVRLEKAGTPMREYERALGFLARTEGNLELAIEYFERTVADYQNFSARFVLAETYLQSGRTADAIKTFEDLLVPYIPMRGIWGHWAVKIHYYLGVAYEETGRFDEAVEQYEIYLGILEDADPGLAAVADAVSRLARLRS